MQHGTIFFVVYFNILRLAIDLWRLGRRRYSFLSKQGRRHLEGPVLFLLNLQRLKLLLAATRSVSDRPVPAAMSFPESARGVRVCSRRGKFAVHSGERGETHTGVGFNASIKQAGCHERKAAIEKTTLHEFRRPFGRGRQRCIEKVHG